jgi:hypothetical protein
VDVSAVTEPLRGVEAMKVQGAEYNCPARQGSAICKVAVRCDVPGRVRSCIRSFMQPEHGRWP